LIKIKSKDEIKTMRESNRIVAELIGYLSGFVKPGISTLELDKIAREFILKKKAKPAFLGYKGYPAAICASVNEEVVHGIPSERRLNEGDIVSIDVGVLYRDFYGDTAWTFPVGRISPLAKKLLKVTEESLYLGIGRALVGGRLSDISNAIQAQAEDNGFSVVRDFVGHGIGREMHEDPQIPNFGPPLRGVELTEGMALAIEPMVNIGGYETELKDDCWTAVTKDGSLSAHFEHTIAVTPEGPVILSKI